MTETRDTAQTVTSPGRGHPQGGGHVDGCRFQLQLCVCRSSRRNGGKVSGSVVQDDEEGHLIFKIGDILHSFIESPNAIFEYQTTSLSKPFHMTYAFHIWFILQCLQFKNMFL